MNRLIFELSWFLISRVQSIWAQMLFKYVIRIAKDEWVQVKIEKHERFSNDLRSMLDAERFTRAVSDGSANDSTENER